METKTLLFILLAVVTALLLAVFQYIFKNREEGQLKYWLSFFRFLTYFLILLLIINPSIKTHTTEIIKPNLVVAVDNSTSIKYNSQTKKVENLVALFKKDKALNTKFSIQYYGFGTNTYQLDSLNFNEKGTDLAAPFQEFSKLFKTGTNPAVLITDGNQTVGNNVTYSNYSSPVFPFIVGDTAVFDDIYIRQLNVNKFTNIKNKFPVELFINYTGAKSISKKLSIYHKKTKVYSKNFHFSKTENTKVEPFFLTASTKGTQYYTATIETLENEQNTINNTKTFSINVIEEKSKVLILASVLHPDLGMLKNAIQSNKQRSVTIATIDKFKEELSDYQLIIMYQPSAEFKNVVEVISDKNLNYFIITGLSTDWKFLNKAQNNFSKVVTNAQENYSPIFNSNYASFLSNDINFSEFAPLSDSFGEFTFSIPYNTLLFQKIGTIKTEKPLLATFENNNQRSAILLGENSWRWRMNSYNENKTFEVFDGFIANLIQYLVSNQKNKQLTVSLEPIYYANQTVRVSASYLDKNFNFDTRAKLWFVVSNKATNFLKKIPFAALETRFIAELSNLSSGEYTYTVSVENQNSEMYGSFKILPFEVEQQYTNANDFALKIFADKTKGEIYYTNQEAECIENLLADTRFKSIQKTNTIKSPLINWEWILALIVLLLSVEWFTRKYFGKI